MPLVVNVQRRQSTAWIITDLTRRWSDRGGGRIGGAIRRGYRVVRGAGGIGGGGTSYSQMSRSEVQRSNTRDNRGIVITVWIEGVRTADALSAHVVFSQAQPTAVLWSGCRTSPVAFLVTLTRVAAARLIAGSVMTPSWPLTIDYGVASEQEVR